MVDFDTLLAILHRRPDARLRQDAAQAMTARANAFDQRALWNEVHLQFASHHLLLGFWIEPYVAHDGLAHQLGPNKLADSATRRRRVIGDHCKIAFVLAHDLVDDPLGAADPHESADHQARTIWDHGNGLVESNGLHTLSSSNGLAALVGAGRLG